jgi:hypothetical protein
MKKQLVLPAYLIVEIIYYLGYSPMGLKMGSNVADSLVPLSFWIICSLVNTYFVYVLLPGYLKRSMKRKNIGLKILFYIVVVFIGFLITNGPVEYLIEG